MEDFKELILWAEEAPARVEELKKVLRLNQNYVEARDHAMLAVGRDCRLRFWTNAAISHAGALFSANLGSIDLDHPAGLAHSQKCTGHPACDKINHTVRLGCRDWRLAVPFPCWRCASHRKHANEYADCTFREPETWPQALAQTYCMQLRYELLHALLQRCWSGRAASCGQPCQLT